MGSNSGNAGKGLLIVDDEPLFRASIADTMRTRVPDLRIHEAGNGREALDLIADRNIHAMVADLRMPIMSGFELLSELQRRGAYVPTVLVTAHGNVEIARDAKGFGVVAYMEKPVDLTTLVDVIGWVLEQPEANAINGVTLEGFLQLLSMERSTCTVRVVGPEGHGVLVFDDGVLEHAAHGEILGHEAVFEIASWPQPAIFLEASKLETSPNIQMPVMELLLEAAVRGDERASEEGVSGASTEEVGFDFSDVLAPSLENNTAPPEEAGAEGKWNMSNVNEVLDKCMTIEGAFAVALVDFESGMTLGTRNTNSAFDIDVAASGNTQVVRSKFNVMQSLKLDGGIEDILISLDTQYHLIRPLGSIGNLFLYLAIDRKRGNLGMARHQLTAYEKELQL